MKNNKPIMLLVLALFSIAFTSSCGRRGNNNFPYYGNGYYGTLNTNTPIVAGNVPVSAQRVSFTVSSAFGTTTTISGGLVPFSPISSGQVTSLSAGSVSTSGAISNLAGMNAYGSSIQLGITSTCGGTNACAGTAPYGNWATSMNYGFNNPFTSGMSGSRFNMTGTITISATDAALMSGFQGQVMGLPGVLNTSALSITSIGLMMNYYGNQLFLGQVYMYLNGTNHGYIMQF